MSTSAEQDLSHLGTEAKRLATRPDAERLQAMRRDRWIDYARASTVLRELERLYETPPRERMPCMLLYGESNIGKTLITRKFEREHPPQFDEARGIEERTIVSMQMPPTPDRPASTPRSSSSCAPRTPIARRSSCSNAWRATSCVGCGRAC